MNEQENKINDLLKLARTGINYSIILLLATFFIFVLVTTKKEIIEEPAKDSGTKMLVVKTVDPIKIDSAEIKNGIHEPSGLIADTGFVLVLNTCTRCHSIDIVKQNRATKEGWKDMIRWMQKTQGLWDLRENEEPILKYLAKNYASTNTGRRKNLENVVWYDLKE